MLTTTIAAFVIVIIAYMILKGYKPQIVLLSAGYFLMLVAVLRNPAFNFVESGYLSQSFSTGSNFLDIFALTGEIFTLRTADFGINVMAIAGFAKYTSATGASRTLVLLAVRPLSRFNSPYFIMALSYVIGQALAMVISSASGLGMLLMVTLYPILTNMGVSKAGATAVIASTSAVAMGPGSSYSLIASKNAGIDIVDYFVHYQLPAGVIVIVTAAVVHYFVQKHFDKSEPVQPDPMEENAEKRKPLIYALIPFLPIILLLAFPQGREGAIHMNIITAVIISVFIGLTIQTLVLRNAKEASNELKSFFDGMGAQFANVMTLIVAGEVFANGLKVIGFLDAAISFANADPHMFTFAIVIITGIFAVIMGSGHAPFISFSGLIPEIAEEIDIEPVKAVLPVQFASGIMRSVSPISGVVVAVSGISNISPVTVVKRTAIPMIAALLMTLAVSYLLF